MKKLNELKQKFKKIDYKDRKYVLPILALPFILFMAYQIYGLVAEEEDDSWMLANHNELNDNLPDASTDDMASRIDALNNSFKGDGYTAMDQLEEEKEEQMQDGSAYTENEKNKLDSLEKVKQQRQKAIQRLQQPATKKTFPTNSQRCHQRRTAICRGNQENPKADKGRSGRGSQLYKEKT